MNKVTIAACIIGISIIGATIVFARGSNTPTEVASVNNVTVAEGKQIIDITAKGGYAPRLTSAKADMPTTLRMKTDGTFDCSSGVTIPSIGYRKILPSTASTDIEVPPQKAGTTLDGVCVMGMYHFAVAFK